MDTPNTSIQLLPVAIMAHNEEKVIKKAIESVLRQKVPAGYAVKIVIAANACNDKTEDIVKEIEGKNPGRIELLSIQEKGKTKAIHRAIDFLDHISKTPYAVPYVIFLDADCEFVGDQVLLHFVEGFDQNNKLCAIAADCLPDSVFNSRKDIVAHMYRAINTLRRSMKINSISGMCYGIRFDILKKIDFPDVQIAEDMYLSSRLDGCFEKNEKIQIVFSAPLNFSNEIKRRTRQELSTQRYRRYYSYLKDKDGRVKLFNQSLGDQYRWGGLTNNNTFRAWREIKEVKHKLLLGVYFLIRGYSKLNAFFILRRLQKNPNLDYWRVQR